ncbi:MAG: VanZ family protein [Lachnospiraceae bacterium]|nr:VanZ family protein [Lachnospiraceae bacterium]
MISKFFDKKNLKLFAFIPAIIMMVIIWGFSGSDANDSGKLSLEVTKRIVDIGNKVFKHGTLTTEEKDALVSKLHTPVRKCAHMTEYALLAICIFLPLTLYIKEYSKVFNATVMFCVFYASTDEFHQIFVEGRAGRLTDVMIDSVGILLASIILLFILNKKKNKITL